MCILTIVSTFCLVAVTEAQPLLTFKRVTVNWPTIELYFTVGCDGQPVYNVARRDFRLYENGVEVKGFMLWCPDPMVRCAISIALVFDASTLMAGAAHAGAKAAGHAFIDLMDGHFDEAAVLWFTDVITVRQTMTTVKPILYSAIDDLPASGGSAVWDGAYSGILEVINDGVNQCRAVIVMTDGEDNSSTRTVAEVIALANRHRIRIFTIGLGSSINSTDLELMAQLTGGKFYLSPNPGQLTAIYQEISTIMFHGVQECVISYQPGCADGGMRTVELQLVDFCNGTDLKMRTYQAPLDSASFSELYMELGKGEGKGDTDIKIPLRLITPISGEMFHPFSFTLEFDQSCVQFESVQTPPGSLLDGMPISITPVATGVLVQVTDHVLINGSGLLMEFTFHASNPLDTTCCEIEAINASFELGCFIPIIESGEICIYPPAPIVTCTMDGPVELVWQRALKDYTPNPFSVTARFVNSGDEEALDARYTITYDPDDVQLVTPMTDVQVGSPKDIAEGNFHEITWHLTAKSRTSHVSTRICIIGEYDNHEEVICCIEVEIPSTDPILDCVIDVPTITADSVTLRYDPMPFPVTVTVTNSGEVPTEDVYATITLPKDLQLATPDIPDIHTKRLLPERLFPNQSGSVSWNVRHPVTDVEKQYVVAVWVKTENADSSLCEVLVTIPPLEAPILSPRCYIPSALTFDEGLDTYVPNPFTVRLTVVNNGNTDAEDVSGRIILPPDMELDPPTQSADWRLFTPSTMPKYVVGQPIPELTWMVRWTKRYRYDVNPDIYFEVTDKYLRESSQYPVTEFCRIAIPGVQPRFDCDIEMPDSLGLNAAGTGVEPNPFTVRYTITNRGFGVGSIRRLIISFPPDDLELDASSPNPRDQTMNLTLERNESETFEWVFRVQNRITRRNVYIEVTAYDDEWTPVPCSQLLPIANLLVSIGGDHERTLSMSTRLEQNRPNPFNPSTTIGYELGEATDYSLTLHDVLGRMVRVLEEGHKAAGRYTVIVEANGLPSGVYLYRLETPTHIETKRMVLAR